MASIRKRILKSGRIAYQVDYRDEHGKRRHIQFPRRLQADSWLEERRHNREHERVRALLEGPALDLKAVITWPDGTTLEAPAGYPLAALRAILKELRRRKGVQVERPADPAVWEALSG